MPSASVHQRPPVAPAPSGSVPASGAKTAAGTIGGAFPTTVERAAQNGSWVVYCQAPKDTDRNGELAVRVGPRGELTGDALSPYLAVGSAEPLAIDALWAVEPSERWLAVNIEGQAVVIDTKDGRRTPLVDAAVDLVESGEPYPLHRALGFEAQLGTLLFVRTLADSGFELRALPAAGKDTTRRFLGQGKFQRLQVSWDGAWSIVESVTEDTNQNGRLDRPMPSGAKKPRCHGPLSSFPAWQQTPGDALTTQVVSARTGEAYRVREFVGPLGDGFLFRDEQGSLWLQRRTGPQRLAGPECGAQVVHADSQRGLVLVACRGPQNDVKPRRSKHKPPPPPRARYPLWLLGEGLSLNLKLELGPTGADRWAESAPRLVPIHAGADRRLLDMDTHALLPLGVEDSVLTTFGSRALLIREGALELVDAVKGVRVLEFAYTERLSSVLVVPGMAWVAPHVIDLGKGVLLGTTDAPGYALSSAGQVLATEQPAREGFLPVGPLVWRTARAR